MRVLIAAFGSHGDVLPLIALGRELVDRGHEVLVASVEPFAEVAREAGVPFLSLATKAQYAGALGHPDLWRPIRGARRLLALAELAIRPTFAFIEERRLPRNVVVVASTLAIGARVAQDAFRIPLVTVHMSPMMAPSRHEPPHLPGMPALGWLPSRMRWNFQLGVDKHVIDPCLTPSLNAFRAELGLPAVKRLRHWWNAPRRVLMMFPPWFAARQPDWPEQALQLGFPRPNLIGASPDAADPALEAFLERGPAPVAITFGTAMRHGSGLYRSAMEACAKIGRRCLVISAEPVEAPQGLGVEAHWARSVSLAGVLPRCAAIVHHGGVGTVAEALAAGLPQLVVPLAFDQADNAERVKRLGCGVRVSRLAFRPKTAARALEGLIVSATVRQSCAAAARLSEPDDAIGRAADAVETEFNRASERLRESKRVKAVRP